MNRQEQLELLKSKHAEADLAGGADRLRKQHEQGKLSARERAYRLCDPGSFVEIDKFVVHRCPDFGLDKKKILGDGVVTGYGAIHGRPVYLFSQDFTVFGGALSGAFAKKICKIMDLAGKNGCPVIGLNDSGGARIQEGVESLAGYAEIFLRNTLVSGVIPQISAILGPCAGGAVYSPAITDFILMARKTSHMFITGPEVIKTVTGEEISHEALGGADSHATRSGVCHFVADSDEHCLDLIRHLMEFIPQNNTEDPPFRPTDDPADRREDSLKNLVPENPNQPYDIKDVITAVVDEGHFFEVHAGYAQNLVVGFAHLGGFSAGIVANQPASQAGALDTEASKKGARFVRFCDCFNIPLIIFEDVPGFLPGSAQEYAGIILHGAKLIYAFCEATVPKITVITRKAYGGAYCVMNSKHIRGDLNYAFPTAEIAVMGPDGAVNIIFRGEIKEAKDKKATKEQLVADYRAKFASPYKAAELGYIDEVILPEDTRPKLIAGLKLLQHKRDQNPPKKHGNIPL